LPGLQGLQAQGPQGIEQGRNKQATGDTQGPFGRYFGGLVDAGRRRDLRRNGAKMEPKSRKGDPGAAPAAKGSPGWDFDVFFVIFGVTFGARGAHVSVLLRSAFFMLFTQASGTAFRRFCEDLWCHSEAFSRGFWAGVESVILYGTIVYNRYFEGPGGCNLASFGHCFFRVLPGAHFL